MKIKETLASSGVDVILYRIAQEGLTNVLRHAQASELTSVTVIAPSATDADALSTTALVLGVKEGLALLNRLPHVEGLFVTKTIDIRQTDGFSML